MTWRKWYIVIIYFEDRIGRLNRLNLIVYIWAGVRERAKLSATFRYMWEKEALSISDIKKFG